MSDVPSVNPEQNPVPDSEGADTQWVDPIFAEMHPERLTDEPEPTSDEIAEAEKATQAEEAAAAEAGRKANGQYTKAELAKLIDELPEDDPEEGAEEKEAEKADDDKAAEEAEKEAAEAKKKEEDDGAEEAKDGKKPRRRSRARRERRAMERQLQEKDAEIARLKGQPAQPEPEPAAEVQPKLEDFETADEWAVALGTWTQNQIDAGKQQTAKAEEAKREQAVHETVRKRIEAYEERAEDMRDLHDDYDEVITDDTLKITPEMAEVIMESELGPQLAYHLGTNPEEAAKIAGLSPLAQAKALAKLETRLEAEQATPEDEPAEGEEAEEADPKSTPVAAKAPRQTPTKAPEPITTVGGGAQAKPDASKLSNEDYQQGRLSGKIK